MKELIAKFVNLESELSDKHGSFALFGLFIRQDVQDLWDVVLSAKWIGKDKKKVLQEIVKKLKKNLTNQETTKISRIVILEITDPFVINVNSVIRVEHNVTEFVDCIFNNMMIKHAYIITSIRTT